MTWPQPGSAWTFTKNSGDPCGLCVQWMEYEDDPYDPDHEAYPYWPDGSVVTRVYESLHEDCYADAVAYTTEAVS